MFSYLSYSKGLGVPVSDEQIIIKINYKCQTNNRNNFCIFVALHGSNHVMRDFSFLICQRLREVARPCPSHYYHPVEKNRIEAFSDGVIAIIITIMVLNLTVPDTANMSELESRLPIFLTYALSYLYVGIYWNNHHHLLKSARRATSGVMWANLHLLFWLSLFPFMTGWMGKNHFQTTPTARFTGPRVAAGGGGLLHFAKYYHCRPRP